MMDKSDTRFALLSLAYNTIVNVFLGGASFVIVYHALSFTGSTSYIQHIILCVLGYNLLMPLSVMPFTRNSGWSQILHKDKKTIHWVFQLCGTALGIAGNVIRIQGWPGVKFSTLHGIMGLLSLIFAIIAVIGGALDYLIKSNKKFLRVCHAVVGLLALVFGFIALWTGLDLPIYRNNMSDRNANTMIAVTVISLLAIIMSTFSNIRKKLS